MLLLCTTTHERRLNQSTLPIVVYAASGRDPQPISQIRYQMPVAYIVTWSHKVYCDILSGIFDKCAR